VRFAHEMNIQTAASPWGGAGAGNSPASFIAAWRHVVTVFRQAGATNVKWVWAPNTDCNGQCPFNAYYPGDAWVDYVGLDGYNFAAAHHIPWMSLASIFQSSYTTLTALSSKPVMFTETASAEGGGSKAAWIIQGFLHDIPTLFPRVMAIIWWQRVDQADWRVNSSTASQAAWRQVVASPLYGGTAPPAVTASDPVAPVNPAPPVTQPTQAKQVRHVKHVKHVKHKRPSRRHGHRGRVAKRGRSSVGWQATRTIGAWA
jgi:hypothetical protein